MTCLVEQPNNERSIGLYIHNKINKNYLNHINDFFYLQKSDLCNPTTGKKTLCVFIFFSNNFRQVQFIMYGLDLSFMNIFSDCNIIKLLLVYFFLLSIDSCFHFDYIASSHIIITHTCNSSCNSDKIVDRQYYSLCVYR